MSADRETSLSASDAEQIVTDLLRERGAAYHALIRRCSKSRTNMFAIVQRDGDPRHWAPAPEIVMSEKPAKRNRVKCLLDYKSIYERWWLGQIVRPAHEQGTGAKVISIEVIGPPSGVYHMAALTCDDGRRINLPLSGGFKPRKADIAIITE